MFKLWRPFRDKFAMHARTLQYHANVRDSSRRFGESIRKPIANSSHPSEIGSKSVFKRVMNGASVWLKFKSIFSSLSLLSVLGTV